MINTISKQNFVLTLRNSFSNIENDKIVVQRNGKVEAFSIKFHSSSQGTLLFISLFVSYRFEIVCCYVFRKMDDGIEVDGYKSERSATLV
jgi:hypothetical protein